MKKILVALDYSPVSKNAFEYALLLAKELKAELTLLNVVMPITNTGEYPSEIIEFARKNEEHRATTLLKKLTTYYPNKDADKFIKHNITINYLVKEGIFVPTIIQSAEVLACDLIIAGTKSGNMFTKIILGSTAKELIKTTTIPTLIIPESYVFKPIKNIAFATALNGADAAAIKYMQELGETLNATVTPFFISELPYDISNETEDEWETWTLPTQNNQTATVRVIRKANFRTGVEYYLNNYPSDMLVMFIPKRSFLNQLFHISKTQQMVVNTKVPLLIYHTV